MTNSPRACLSIDNAVEYVGDMQGVLSLLGTLQHSLENDLPHIQARLNADDLPGANRILHQLKGFAPVFCADDLVAEVVRVESLSKGTDAQATREAYAQLEPKLQRLLAEVQTTLAQAS